MEMVNCHVTIYLVVRENFASVGTIKETHGEITIVPREIKGVTYSRFDK